MPKFPCGEEALLCPPFSAPFQPAQKAQFLPSQVSAPVGLEYAHTCLPCGRAAMAALCSSLPVGPNWESPDQDISPVGIGPRQLDWNELEMSRMPTGTLDLAPEKPT